MRQQNGKLPPLAKSLGHDPDPGPFKPGEKVLICGGHPWRGHTATLQAFERYGMGWIGWRMALTDLTPKHECYASVDQLQKVHP